MTIKEKATRIAQNGSLIWDGFYRRLGLMTCKGKEYQPVIIMGRDESGKRIELQFPTERDARWARAYWRLFEAFNPHLPNAEKVSDSEIGPLLIELVEANKIDSLSLKEALREIAKGEFTDSL